MEEVCNVHREEIASPQTKKDELILACPTLRRELLSLLAGKEFSVRFLPGRLHRDPQELRAYLQETLTALTGIRRVYLCPSGCGGGTEGLRAGAAELVIPRTRDCLDILLSGEKLSALHRDIRGVFMTESWVAYTKHSEIDYDRVMARMGEEAGRDYLRRLYRPIRDFYLIDTGCYDLRPVEAYVASLAELVEASVTVVPGPCGILHKIAAGRIDEDFLVLSSGETVPKDAFLPNV